MSESLGRYYAGWRELAERQKELKSKWSKKLEQKATPNAAILRQIVASMRSFSGERDEGKITPQKYGEMAMDLLCEAICAGAFMEAEWIKFRTRLASDPSFENAVKFLATDTPSSSSIIVAVMEKPDDGTFQISSYIDRFADEMEATEAIPGSGITPKNHLEAYSLDVFGGQSALNPSFERAHREEIDRVAGGFRLAVTKKWPPLMTAMPVHLANQVRAWLIGEKKFGPSAAGSLPISKATELINDSFITADPPSPIQNNPPLPTPPVQIPLTDLQRFVLEIIKSQPADQAISGKRIIEVLASKYKRISSEQTLTTHIIPVLKPLGVKSRKKHGYWFESSGLK